MAFDVQSGFKVGQAIGGGSAIGAFVKQLNAKADQLGLSKLIAGEQAKNALDPRRQLAARKLSGPSGVLTDEPESGFKGFQPTRMTTPEGVTFENIGAKTEEVRQREAVQRESQVIPDIEALSGQLKAMKRLGDQIPRAKPGLFQRPFSGAKTALRGAAQTLPQVDLFNNKKKLVAGLVVRAVGGEKSARLSDFDVQRALSAIGNATFDTRDNFVTSFLEMADAINGIPEVKAANKELNPLELLSVDEFKLGRKTQGVPDTEIDRELDTLIAEFEDELLSRGAF